MMNNSNLLAGAGKAVINLDHDVFPQGYENYIGIHDNLHVRVLIIRSDDIFVIVSLEMTSLMSDDISAMKAQVAKQLSIQEEAIWICVTHTFSVPHFLVGPAGETATESEKKKNQIFKKAVYSALSTATSAASARLREAEVYEGFGSSNVNSNRDITSEEGWWIGINKSGLSDKTLSVLLFREPTGEPIALLYNYGMQSSVMDGICDPQGGRVITGDLIGEISRQVETAFGNDSVAVFLPGASGDQCPRERAKYIETDETGKRIEKYNETHGFSILTSLGREFTNDILRIAEHHLNLIEKPYIRYFQHSISCPKQKRNFTGFPVPTKDFISQPDGMLETTIHTMCIGKHLSIVGVLPELNCITATQIKANSPYRRTLVVQMVNGGQKYMADQESYNRMTYEAMNSFFGPGSAELLCDEIVASLISLRNSTPTEDSL